MAELPCWMPIARAVSAKFKAFSLKVIPLFRIPRFTASPVKAKKVCQLRYGNQLVMTPGILISKGQPCPTSSDHELHQAILSASMSSETTSLESIAEISDRQGAKTAKSSIFFLSSPYLPPAWHDNG